MNSSFFVPKSWNRYGCETPARRAIASVEVPASPLGANSTAGGRDHRVAALFGGEAGEAVSGWHGEELSEH